MIYDESSNSDLLKIIFDLKSELSSYKNEMDLYKKETDKKIVDLENLVSTQQQMLIEKDNEIFELKQTIVELKQNHAEATAVMRKEIKELKEENKSLKKIIKEKDIEIAKLNNRINSLEKENKKYKDRLSKNSSNSSKPPSTNGFHKVVHSLREKSDTKVGGQPNHEGSTLTNETIEKIKATGAKNVIVRNETIFVNKKKFDGKIKRKLDIEMSVIITEYHLVYKKDAQGLPNELRNNVIYGENLKALVVLLTEEHAVAVKRVVNIICELTDSLIKLSTGTVMNIIYEGAKKLLPFIVSLQEFLLRCNVANKDETMVPCNGFSWWFHVFSNDKATYYYYHQKRGSQADIEKGVLRIFTGTLVHDHLKGLYSFQSDDAECNAHILRYLTFVEEQYNRKWAKDLRELLLEIKKEIEKEMANGNNCLKVSSILAYEDRYYKILEDGNEEFKKDKNTHKDYNGEDMKLLRRLKKYGENHLAFMYDFNIPFDNNLAERDLRMIKAKKKIAGGFRSEKGGEAYATVKSYSSTMKKQGKNLYESLKSAFIGKPVLLKA